MRSKPDPVDQSERTAHYDCAMCIAEMLHNTSAHTVLLIFPFPPEQHHCSDEAKWRLGCCCFKAVAYVTLDTLYTVFYTVSHKKTCHFVFDYNSCISWSNFILFIPVETGRSTL